ncbi:MAG: hypothetical protein IKM66_00665 [Clostridia bacterium]|nr:hypothetical protein [Clostridia bacterium]
MKKRIITLIVAIAMLFAVSVTASAEAPEIGLESSYNAETGLVTVSVYAINALGLQSADLNLGFSEDMYKFEEYTAAETTGFMIVGGYIEDTPGLCTSSVIFTEKCVESDLDSNGRLNIATFTFKPVNDEYDINEFCLWASSFDVNDVNVVKTVKAVGNTMLQEDKTEDVTLKKTEQQADDAQEKTTKKTGTANTQAEINSNWYVYLIAGVLAVGAIAGIAFVAIKSSHNNENSEEKDNSDSDEKQE